MSKKQARRLAKYGVVEARSKQWWTPEGWVKTLWEAELLNFVPSDEAQA